MTAISSVVAIAVTVIIIIIAIYYGISIMNKYIELASKAIETTLQTYEVCIPNVKLENYTIYNNIITLNITLLKCEVPVKKFKYVDFIIMYKDINNVGRIEWIYYSKTCTSGTWCIVSTYNDLVNPINITSQTGIWNSGEILEINITTYFNISNVISIRMIFPTGYYIDFTFT